MKNKVNLWNLHQTANTYGARPSEILHIVDQWAAYCLDTATLYWGNYIESKINELDEKTHKPKYRLEDLLRDTNADSAPQPTKRVVDRFKNIRGLVEVING